MAPYNAVQSQWYHPFMPAGKEKATAGPPAKKDELQ
jgi:hypothetical protein